MAQLSHMVTYDETWKRAIDYKLAEFLFSCEKNHKPNFNEDLDRDDKMVVKKTVPFGI